MDEPGHTPANVKLLLPPRQSRGNSHFGLGEQAVLLLMSTDNRIDLKFIDFIKNWGARVIYDYIDHIDAAISLADIPQGHLQAHSALLRDESVLVVTAARVLFDEVLSTRIRNVILAQNAADGSHFRAKRQTSSLVPEMAAAVRRGRPIVGYFGALASWFDYGLVLKLARSRPDISVVLIGPDYDGSCRRWRREAGELPANLLLVPAVSYDCLPAQAAWFDVGIVPFLINDITLATSPLKLYEYFAIGLPVVSTRLPECERHQSAVLIADDCEDFMIAVDRALTLRNDSQHQSILAREAAANDWRARAEAIMAGLQAADISAIGSDRCKPARTEGRGAARRVPVGSDHRVSVRDEI